MKAFPLIFKWSLFFAAAVVFALGTHWVRQRPPTLSETGWVYQKMESLDQSGDLHNALKLLPEALNDPGSRDAALRFQQSLEERKAGIPAALTALNDEINGTERRYKIPKLTFLKGVVADLEQDNQLALHWYQSAIDMKPKLSVAHVRLGLVYERLGQIQKADKSFQKALELSQRAPLSHFHYGLFLARSTDRSEEALQEAKFLEDVRPVYARIIRETVPPQAVLSVSTTL